MVLMRLLKKQLNTGHLNLDLKAHGKGRVGSPGETFGFHPFELPSTGNPSKGDPEPVILDHGLTHIDR